MSEKLNFSYQRFDCSHSISSMTWRVPPAFQRRFRHPDELSWNLCFVHPYDFSSVLCLWNIFIPFTVFVRWNSSNSNGKLKQNATIEGIRHTQHVSICFCSIRCQQRAFHSLSHSAVDAGGLIRRTKSIALTNADEIFNNLDIWMLFSNLVHCYRCYRLPKCKSTTTQ